MNGCQRVNRSGNLRMIVCSKGNGMICVIGSHAANMALMIKRGQQYRHPKDLDILGEKDESIAFANGEHSNKTVMLPPKGNHKITFKCGESTAPSHSRIIECEIVTPNSSAEQLRNLILNDSSTIYQNGVAYASLDVCYMLKMSHRFRKNSPHFLKTMRDIHNFRRLGAIIRPEHKEFF